MLFAKSGRAKVPREREREKRKSAKGGEKITIIKKKQKQ